MTCRYCNATLAPLRSLTDGEFCCDDHRHSFRDEQASPPPPEVLLPLNLEQHPAPPEETANPAFSAGHSFLGMPRLPELTPQAADWSEESGEGGEAAGPLPSDEAPASMHWLKKAWKQAPADLKIITLLLPILLAVAVSPTLPKVMVPNVSSTGVQRAMSDNFKNLHQSILNRAAIEYADDFRSGLDAWESHSNLTASWSYDASGFVQPGPLAIFKPSMDLADYRFEFLGEIDQKGLGFAFRAPNLNNYYAVKLVVSKPGPIPLIKLIRYAVINGKEGPHVEKPLPMTVRRDMLYRILLDVRGSDFTIMAQGQVVDFWSDDRLPRGGVGFFCSRGEKARVRWVEVSHQYDALGRLCAYLAPYGMPGRNGNWN